MKFRTAFYSKLEHRSDGEEVSRNCIFLLHLDQSIFVKQMQPTARVSLMNHFSAERSDKGPIFVAIGAFHLGHDVHARVESREIIFPWTGLTNGSAKDIECRYFRLGIPLEVARPSADVPTPVQGRADVTSVMARIVSNASFTKQLQERAKGIRMAKQITIFRGLSDSIVDTGQTAGDGAENSTGSEFGNEIFEKYMQVSRIHGRDLPRRNRFVNNCNKAPGGVLSEGWPAYTTISFD